VYKIEDIVNKIHCADCFEFMKEIPDNSIDSIVTDPPAGINFMGKTWDDFTDKGLFAFQDFIYQVFSEAIRVLKPGGYALVWAIPRTSHHTAMGIERAGFEIRDKVYFVFGSGFPKSLNISKAIEATEKYGKSGTKTLKQIEQDGNGEKYILNGRNNGILGEKKVWERKTYIPKGIAKQYEGWGTALKPAVEEWILARKPLSEKTVAQNVLKWETGGLNIDGCRIPCNNKTKFPEGVYSTDTPVGKIRNDLRTSDNNPTARFPSHLILDGSEEVEQCFPNQKSGKRSSEYKIGNDKGEMFNHGIYGKYKVKKYEDIPASEGSASRFFQHCPLTEEDLEYNRIFYGSKASKAERNFGLEGFEKKVGKIIHNRRCKICHHQEVSGSPCRCENPDWEILSKERKAFNNHPTVKPISLMRYLCRLITPKNGIVLDMFAGSGSTLIAAKQEGFNYIGIERESDYVKIAEARLKAVNNSLYV